MSKRKNVEKYIIDLVNDLDKSGKNGELYKQTFKNMSNVEFDNMMEDMKNGDLTISMIVPNNSDVKITYENNKKVFSKMGGKYFHRLTFDNKDGVRQSNVETLVFDIPVKRLSQLITKKISVAEDNKTVNSLTGTVTGKSASAKLSLAEIQILHGLGLDKTIDELFKVRGGDTGQGMALDRMLALGLKPELETIKKYATGSTSVRTFKHILLGAHLKLDY